jgi:hypothetical protein
MAVELIDSRRIWDKAPHNAMTDLVRFGNRWLCAFREGTDHHSFDGCLRILGSADGKQWQPLTLISKPGADLRDPKLSVMPDGRLMLLAGARYPRPNPVSVRSMVWFSADGRAWGEPTEVADPDFWLWRATWHEGRCYGVAYGTDGKEQVRLYRSADGVSFETLVDELYSKRLQGKGRPSEASLVFLADGTCHCLLRRDADTCSAQLGTARPPYSSWSWQDLGRYLGGPHLIRLPDGQLVAAGRLLDGDGRARTSLLRLDPTKGTLEELATLPSGGDTSYPGLALHEGRLWVSYYSSHEGRTAIYLARATLP